jgi:hypothetical protein
LRHAGLMLVRSDADKPKTKLRPKAGGLRAQFLTLHFGRPTACGKLRQYKNE